jgi:hypothetical protein
VWALCGTVRAAPKRPGLLRKELIATGDACCVQIYSDSSDFDRLIYALLSDQS